MLTGAGVNIAIANDCLPAQQQLMNLTYQKISQNIYNQLPVNYQSLFQPHSFDYILGGLITISLAMEKTKLDAARFGINPNAFGTLFQTTGLQQAIINALNQIEQQLTITLQHLMSTINIYDQSIQKIAQKYNSFNYFTLNFDGIFDHVIYGENYSRGGITTDFWNANGTLNEAINRQMKVYHLHGDLRYKPSKRTNYHNPPYQWPTLVVGDAEVKKGIIASHHGLRFYNQKLRDICSVNPLFAQNTLLIAGFGFRAEDEHIIAHLNKAFTAGVFNNILIYDVVDHLANTNIPHQWIDAKNNKFVDVMNSL